VEGLRKVLPMLVIYALSFVEVGIYWVNHHYMVDDVERVSHGLLWANLGFLFSLSLIPFGTAWVGERGLTPFALSLYSICCALPAVSWIVLSIVVRHRAHMPLAGSPIKQATSSALYVGVIPVSYHSLTTAVVMLAAVAVLWLVPPKWVLAMTHAKQQGCLNLTATTFRHSIAYRRTPIAISLSWVRVMRPSAHRMIELTR
jgi:uncharacterized membrane protein